MDKRKLCLCTKLTDEDYKIVEKYCDITIGGALKTGNYSMAEEDVFKQLRGNEIVVTMDEFTGYETINKLADEGLKFMIAARGTPTMTDMKALKERNIPLGYAPGRNAVSVSEFTLMLMMMLTKKVNIAVNKISNGYYLGQNRDNIYDYIEKRDINWPRDRNSPFYEIGLGHELFGKTVGIIGFGAIGKKVAKLCGAFGMVVYANDKYCSKEVIEDYGAIFMEIEELLKASDIISVHLPVTDETRFMIDDSWFNIMKPTSLFINTARAAVVNQESMVKALSDKKISGAACDVFWEEPIPENHPFLEMDNVIVTPHMAAMTEEAEYYWTSKMVREHIVNYCEDKPLKNLWNIM